MIHLKKVILKSVSALLTLIILISCMSSMFTTAFAATENGYDRGYDGGFAGDGVIYCNGLDLSSWQKGAVNFTAVAAMGYEYVILRLGTSNMTAVDTCFEQFYSEAKAAGLDVGAYYYSYATTVAEVKEDIAKCKSWLGDKKLEYPFYFDYEDSSQANLESSLALSIINTFIEAFVDEGYLMGLYSMKSWMTQSWITSSSIPSTYEGWVAHYAGDGTYDAGYDKYGTTYSTQYGMYQYTDKHYFTYNGTKYGPYDANICYKDYPSIVKEYGFNNYEPSGNAALTQAMNAAMSITHRDYTEATIMEIRKAYKEASALLSSSDATSAQLNAAQTKLTNLIANTGTNTIAKNNEGIEIKGRNKKIVSGSCNLYSPTFNNGLITVSNANIAYTINVVFKWDPVQKFNVVKSISEGIGVNTPSIQLESDEFLIAAHDWESGVTTGAVAGSAKNYSLLKKLNIGDRIVLSGATALNNGTDVEPAAFAKFMPADSFAVYQRNEAITKGSSGLFTSVFNSGLLTSANANIHLTLNMIAKWDNNQSSWVVKDKFEGSGVEGESSNIELASDEILFAAHYDTENSASIYNWSMLNNAKVGDKITFSGISPEATRTGVSVSANISFADGKTTEPLTPENLTTSGTTVTKPQNTTLDANLTDGIAGTELDDEWFGFLNVAGDKNCNTENSTGEVVIDLGKRYSLDTISAHVFVGGGTDKLNGYSVGKPSEIIAYVSLDGVTYYELSALEMGECAIGTCWATLTGVPSVARFVKLSLKCQYDWTLINEIKITGTAADAVSGINVALGKDYVAPAYQGSPYTASLTDGKATNIFQPGVNNSSWFGFYNSGNTLTGNINPNNNNLGIGTIDLGGIAEVTGVNFNHFVGTNTAGAVTFEYIKVYYSTSGKIYSHMGTIYPVASQTSPYKATLNISSAPVNARYIKFALCGAQGELILINEVEVMGTMLTSGAYSQAGSMSAVALTGEFNNWNPTPNMTVIDGETVTTTLELEAGKYEFKILEGSNWYGNGGAVYNTTVTSSDIGWEMTTDAGNCTLVASGGTYTFTYNKSTRFLQVVYTPDTCYLRGDFNSWGTDSVMTDNANGKLSYTLTLDGGTYEYKIANEDYSLQWPEYNASITLPSKSEVTFVLDLSSGEIKTNILVLEYTVTFLDRSGNVISEQKVNAGESATAPTPPEVTNYRFTGWSEDFSCVSHDLTVRALYEKSVGTLKVNVTGGTGFTISVNDSAPRTQGTSYQNTKTPIGAKITLTAISTNDNKFIGWVTASDNRVISTSKTFTFYSSGNDFYRAMYRSDVDGCGMVAFCNDKSKQYIEIQYYSATDSIDFPDAPTAAAFDFVRWDHTEAEIQEKLAKGMDVNVMPVWEIQKVYVEVNVNGGSVTNHSGISDGKYLANVKVTITADAAEEGMKFAYWMDSFGKIKSFEQVYSFYPAQDTTLMAIFVTEDTEIDYEALVDVNTFTPAGDYGQFSVSWYVPEEALGVTYIAGGLVAVNKDFYSENTFYHGTTDTNVWDKTGSTTNPSSTYVWTGPVYSGETWVARAWVQFKDATGTIHTIYSDLYTATKN